MNTPTRILIVDDEPNVRLVFRTALESAGHCLAEALDGEDALTQVRAACPDLILLDLQMPRLDGMATLQRLRDSGHETPVVIITAHGSVPDAVAAMKLGAIDFLAKPLVPETLRAVVAEVIARHAAYASVPAPSPSPAPGRTPYTPAPPPEPVTVASQYAANLAQAKRALNHRWFDEAEIYLKQAIALRVDAAEAHNLRGVLHELRGEHDASYREYRAALKADHHYEPARNNMTRYYERFTFGRSTVPIDTGDR
jgi:DNA-binding response OmpR family regulator